MAFFVVAIALKDTTHELAKYDKRLYHHKIIFTKRVKKKQVKITRLIVLAEEPQPIDPLKNLFIKTNNTIL